MRYISIRHHVTHMKAVGASLLSALRYEVNEDWDLNTYTYMIRKEFHLELK